MEIKYFPYICMLYIGIYLHSNNTINDEDNNNNNSVVKSFKKNVAK